jgi:hypothetical protein
VGDAAKADVMRGGRKLGADDAARRIDGEVQM